MRAVRLSSCVHVSRERRAFDAQCVSRTGCCRKPLSACVEEWTWQRLHAMLGGEPAPVDMRLCLNAVANVFESFPSLVALATFRLIGSAWPTS